MTTLTSLEFLVPRLLPFETTSGFVPVPQESTCSMAAEPQKREQLLLAIHLVALSMCIDVPERGLQELQSVMTSRVV